MNIYSRQEVANIPNSKIRKVYNKCWYAKVVSKDDINLMIYFESGMGRGSLHLGFIFQPDVYAEISRGCKYYICMTKVGSKGEWIIRDIYES